MPNGYIIAKTDYPISKDDFQKIKDVNLKLDILYGYIDGMNDRVVKLMDAHDQRISKLEKRSKWDKTISAISGFVGGMLAVIFKSVGLLKRM